jgi:hypothetical protein
MSANQGNIWDFKCVKTLKILYHLVFFQDNFN